MEDLVPVNIERPGHITLSVLLPTSQANALRVGETIDFPRTTDLRVEKVSKSYRLDGSDPHREPFCTLSLVILTVSEL